MSSPRRVLIVCTGNTCRSPMAQVLLQRLKPDWEVRSAGVAAQPGQPASTHAQRVAADRGLDLNAHRSRAVDSEALAWADEVLCLTSAHQRALLERFPQARGKSSRLGPRDISDPYGGSLADYQRCAEEIEQVLTSLTK